MKYLILAILFISGCASQQMWNLNGQSEAAFRAADIQCWEYANHAYAGADYSTGHAAYNAGASGEAALVGAALGLVALGGAGKQSLHDDCLRSQGFVKATDIQKELRAAQHAWNKQAIASHKAIFKQYPIIKKDKDMKKQYFSEFRSVLREIESGSGPDFEDVTPDVITAIAAERVLMAYGLR